MPVQFNSVRQDGRTAQRWSQFSFMLGSDSIKVPSTTAKRCREVHNRMEKWRCEKVYQRLVSAVRSCPPVSVKKSQFIKYIIWNSAELLLRTHSAQYTPYTEAVEIVFNYVYFSSPLLLSVTIDFGHQRWTEYRKKSVQDCRRRRREEKRSSNVSKLILSGRNINGTHTIAWRDHFYFIFSSSSLL